MITEMAINNKLGDCGLYFQAMAASPDVDKLGQIILQQAQIRLQQKKQQLLSQLSKRDFNAIEQLLFAKIFECFGYKKWAPVFKQLAADYPYEQISKLLSSEVDHGIFNLLAQWGSKTGLLTKVNSANLANFPTAQLLQAKTARLAAYHNLPGIGGIHRNGHPLRRLLGMLQLLYNTRQKGLLRSWLAIFDRWQSLPDNQDWASPVVIKKTIGALFAKLSAIDYLDQQLTGEDRIAIIVGNAIIPLFLIWSDEIQSPELATVLFKLYYTLPGEKGHNSAVRLMEQRLNNPPVKPILKKSIAYAQGMLQIKQNVCLSFDDNCRNCLLMKWLRAS